MSIERLIADAIAWMRRGAMAYRARADHLEAADGDSEVAAEWRDFAAGLDAKADRYSEEE